MRNTDFFYFKREYVKGKHFYLNKETKKENQIKEYHQKRHTFNKGKKRETKETTEIKE